MCMAHDKLCHRGLTLTQFLRAYAQNDLHCVNKMSSCYSRTSHIACVFSEKKIAAGKLSLAKELNLIMQLDH